jgi:hypothetical protein
MYWEGKVVRESPYAAVQLPPFSLWVLLGYYAIEVGGWLSHQIAVE